jgi:hypothetical protein
MSSRSKRAGAQRRCLGMPLICINGPDSSKYRCPGCPVTESCNTPGCYSPSAKPTSRWAQEPEATPDLPCLHEGSPRPRYGPAPCLIRTICDTGGHRTPPAIKEIAAQSPFASPTPIVLPSRCRTAAEYSNHRNRG